MVGAIVAAAVAWISILIAVRVPLPRSWGSPMGVRRLGGLTIALFAMQVLGVAMPFWVPLAVFFIGLGLLLLVRAVSDASLAVQH